MTGFDTPSSACTRSPDEICTDGFSSSNWPERISGEEGGGGGGAHGGGGGGLREERRGGACSRVSIGYPRMSASGESSTTMHRLLHASGSHPIPTPYDPNMDIEWNSCIHLEPDLQIRFDNLIGCHVVTGRLVGRARKVQRYRRSGDYRIRVSTAEL
ncbi:1-aminocyclopropane-1-carboxylate synthase-like [Dorcoceras hygrometricum]|uniref:1-aminocyclopropane-1-carboxylate synthase-like n=1 Tax=Dorcoceras hygrometricum TaxID=472368 RepID=A0A2Z6ZXU9_9LAMI|nr:1-aminocyclopropane-1-carboxylate synthase-like [Dorcoceras hygrometricum]